MKILVLTGSPHANGTTAVLTEQFIGGAAEAGHEVTRFDCAKLNIGGCLACDACGNDGECVQKDDMSKIVPALLEAELVVFVTPLYYFGMSSQLKRVIDRFYSVNTRLCNDAKSAMLIAACGDEDVRVLEPLVMQYRAMLDYLGWREDGMVLANGMETRSDVIKSSFPSLAYELGHFAGDN